MRSYGSEKRPKANEEIKSTRVLLITEGSGAEEMTGEEALARAKAAGTDLIEVSPKANPPVVKIGDLGRHLYQLKKKEQKQRSHNKQTEVKMLRFGFRTERHDVDRLLERAREFMAERHLVKFVIRLRGRELTNKDYARKKLEGVLQDLKDESELEQDVRLQGNIFSAIVRPKR